ncbi:MAG: response regulator transcription factor [Acidobacteriota bacterium]|nr:MAG: response regulator transcription factor [Acidobacteriota bacterium]
MDTSGSSLRVLIADANRDFQAVARTWLERQPRVGTVRVASSGRETLAAVVRSEVDLVLVDAVLEDMDGFEATRQIKSHAEPPLVVILVLYDYKAVREEAQIAGADACIDKSALTQKLAPILDDFVEQIGSLPRPEVNKRLHE